MTTWPVRAALVVAVAATPASVRAQNTATTQFTVGAEISSGCAIGGSTQTTGLDFGTLDFGSVPAVATGAVTASAAATGGGAMQLQCTPGIVPRVTVGAGLHASGASRYLARSGGSDVVAYGLFSDAGHTTPIPIGTPVDSTTVGASGVITLPVYAEASMPGGGLMPGAYSDLLSVTISW